jgi:phosphohistidine phosphatase SixA
MHVVLALLVIALPLAGNSAAVAQDSFALWAKLKEGGRVALVRHADAPGGAGDPPGFRLDNCGTQRNLSAQGRKNAQALGERFRDAGIAVGKVLSSRWCRCRETAELMALGPIEAAPTFDNAYVLSERRDELTAGGRRLAARWPGPGTLVVVTHGANILALTGIRPAEGGIVVVEPESAEPPRFKVLGQIVPQG